MSQALEGSKLDESLRTTLDTALKLGADLEVELGERLRDFEELRLTEKLSDWYAESSKALEGLKLDESLRTTLDTASASQAGLELELRQRFAEWARDLEEMRFTKKLSERFAEVSHALEGVKLDESLRTTLDSALGLEADVEVELRQHVAEWVRDLEALRLTEKLSAAQEGLEKIRMGLGERFGGSEGMKLDESLRNMLDSALELEAEVEVETRQRLANWAQDLEELRLSEGLSAAQEGIETVSSGLRERLSELLRQVQ